MKKTKFAILILACILLLASCASTEGGEVDFNALYEGVQKVIEVPELSQNEIFVKANNWAVSAFANADSVIEFTDKESGTITGKYASRWTGNMWSLSIGGGKVAPWTFMQIDVKEGKARILLKLSSIDFYNGYGVKISGNQNSLFVEQDAKMLTEKWESLMADFEKALKTEAVEW